MRLFNASRLCQAICFATLSFTASASEQPDADSLVGNTYLGGHLTYFKTDLDRLFTSDSKSAIDGAAGFGGEFGYRITPFYEARLSLSKLNIDTGHKGFDVPSGTSTAFDLLYFPKKANFYFVAGADFLDINHSNLSADLGMGYRHYLSENTALYIEGKSHYQFDDHYVDYSSKIGFVYYFGTKPAPIKRAKKVAAQPTNKAVSAPKDSDADGVFDANDQCSNTPMTDKVDANGCTIFTEQQETINLIVNFANNKSDVDEQYLSEIARVAEFMKQYSHVDLTINGHTSAVGEAAYNQQLSEKRAQAIVDVLVNNFAIEQSRLTAIGHGEAQLVNEANTPAAHAQNRRIQAKVQTTKKVAIKR